MDHQLLTRQAELLVTYLNNELSPDEVAELDAIKQQSAVMKQLYDNVTNVDWLSGEFSLLRRANVKAAWKLLKQKRAALPEQIKMRQWRNAWRAAAAVIFLFISVEMLFRFSNSPGSITDHQAKAAAFTPGITLTPSPDPLYIIITSYNDTAKIDNTSTGQIIEKDGSRIDIVNGQLVYYDNSSSELFVRLETLPGKRDTITLADKSQVSLMPFTRIQYPLSGDVSRIISINGEANFAVVKTGKPFTVKLPEQAAREQRSIEVTGTSFNVKAYDNDKEATVTLFEGKVKLIYGETTQELQVGQQVKFKADGGLATVSTDNTKSSIEKYQLDFHFERATFAEVTRQLERLYAVKFQLPAFSPPGTFRASFPRSTTLEEVILELQDRFAIKIQRNGNILTVSKSK